MEYKTTFKLYWIQRSRRCTVDGKLTYRFDIHLQGEAETVFSDF